MEKYVITMLGEKDHGKSTLIGNLLIATDSTTKTRIAEVKKASKSKRFEPAHILDSFFEEREQEMTIDTTRAEIVYKKAILELIDVPGHLELIKNMMSGASNSEIAILMVSVKKGEGFRPQTKRHMFLSSMFGVKALIVAINKMDYAKYDRKVYESAKREVEDYLKSINFNKPVVFLPISAYNNENLVSKSKKMQWYTGKPLIETVRDFAERYSRGRSGKSGLRILVQDSVELHGESTIFGLLYNGKVKKNEHVRIEPENTSGRIENLYVKGKKVLFAEEGNNLAITFDRDLRISKGSVIYGKENRPHKSGSFSAKMFIIRDMDAKNPKKLTIKINNNNIALKGMRIRKVMSPISGQVLDSTSNSATANNVVYAEIALGRRYPVERFEDYSELGRFAIYEKEDFVGVGIVE